MTDKVPKGWKRVKLGEVAEIIGGGTPKTKVPEYWNGNIPWLTPKDLSNFKGIYISHGERFITKLGLQESSAKLLPKGSILLTSRAPVGYLAIAKNEIATNQGFRSLVVKNGYDNLFVFYLLKNNIEYLKSQATGTTFGEISGSTLKLLEFSFPPLPEQKAIASVLSSLDDKIDLLHRQNKTLEKMAETLFRQWFIEEAKEDWEEVSLGDSELAKIIKSGIKKFDGIKIYLATGDVNDTEIQGGEYITYDKRPSRANMQPIEFSVWFAKKGGVKKLLMFDDYSDIDNIILSTGFTGLKTTELSHYYIWCFILSEEFQEIKDSFVSGTVQPDINNEGVKQIMILKPDKETLERFNKIVKPYFMKIQSNKNQILTLEKLRDTLLPKLMSGEVRVSI
ncbi:restriction endonuclease subunit S [Deferribacter autotrophicus]|uniref:Restriction endonuclease subunit S n=1 Tax=Deferribacter autotrophicus TaxID=500465 RepID=A0A5A8F7N9_9BACT|nr:restriction endonuclease subunit S [Deferribacter autotrophicus]KAA0259088.1 restriction endonuclease subunit S [Deferribacter autotrophicus]